MDEKRDHQLAPGVGSHLIQGHVFTNVFLLQVASKSRISPSAHVRSSIMHLASKWEALFTADIMVRVQMDYNILLVPQSYLSSASCARHGLTWDGNWILCCHPTSPF